MQTSQPNIWCVCLSALGMGDLYICEEPLNALRGSKTSNDLWRF